MKIRTRLTLSHISIVLFILVAMYAYLDYLLKQALNERITGELTGQTTVAREFLQEMLPNVFTYDEVDALIDRLGRGSRIRLSFIDTEGVVWGDTERDGQALRNMENHAKRPEIRAALGGQVGPVDRYSSTVQGRLRYLALPVLRDGAVIGVCRTALPLGEISAITGRLRGLILLASGVGLVVAILLSVITSGAIAKPIGELNRITQSIASGKIIPRMSVATYSMSDELGQLSRFFNQMADRIQAQIYEISQERDRLETILTRMVEGVLLVNAKFAINYANPAASSMLNLPSNYLRRTLIEVVRNPDLHHLLRQAEETRKVAFAEVSLVGMTARETEISVVPAFSRTDPAIENYREYVVVIHDVSQVRRLERIRADFVANVSHELRTPLTSIQGYAETLLHGALEDQEASQRFVGKILQQASQLSRLISDLLDLSRIESGAVKLNLAPHHINEFREPITSLFDSALEEANLTLDWNISETLPPVSVDKRFLEQVFVNLIDNAIKYTPAGGCITVSADASRSELIVHIRDTGIGIPSDMLPRIFERFYRVDKARSREMGGTGLGLSIAKHILLQHGGQIWAESVLGKGSVFHFALPHEETGIRG